MSTTSPKVQTPPTVLVGNIKNGAFIHSMDLYGKDCCDKAKMNRRYKHLTYFKGNSCEQDPSLRKFPPDIKGMMKNLRKR